MYVNPTRVYVNPTRVYVNATQVMGALARHGLRFGRSLQKATRLTLRLLDAFVLPDDLSVMELDAHLQVRQPPKGSG